MPTLSDRLKSFMQRTGIFPSDEEAAQRRMAASQGIQQGIGQAGNVLFGSPGRIEQRPTMSPQSQEILNNLLANLQSQIPQQPQQDTNALQGVLQALQPLAQTQVGRETGFGDVISGAGVGAQIGTSFGGYGAPIGAAIGAGLPLAYQLYQYFRPQRISPEQQAAQQALSYLSQSPQFQAPDYSGIEQEARRKFQEETIPQIAERFAGRQGSSAFQRSLGRAGSDLESRLAALRGQQQERQQQFGLQSEQLRGTRAGQLLNYLSGQQARQTQQQLEQDRLQLQRDLGLGSQNLQQQRLQQDNLRNLLAGLQIPTTEDVYIPGQEGFIPSAARSALPAAGQAIRSLASGFLG